MKKNTISDIQNKKTQKEKIVMITAYDYPSAKIVDASGVDIILTGDSVGMTVLGYDSTLKVTMDDIIRHTSAVVRAKPNALVVADMPFMSAQISIERGMENATRLIQEAGAQAVKIEGAGRLVSLIERLVESGIPVMGHLGLTPQSVNQLGGYRVQGKNEESAKSLESNCQLLESAGVFSLLLECIPEKLGKYISEMLTIPTIGIGAGRFTDGQVLVFHDVLGYGSELNPKFVKRYVKVDDIMKTAVSQYVEEVKTKKFPEEKHVYQ